MQINIPYYFLQVQQSLAFSSQKCSNAQAIWIPAMRMEHNIDRSSSLVYGIQFP